ncbi:gustatory receptor for sugar taste 64f [Halyomorpha halys]|uniref:gustatory receptor for sugar taste 64f n=1 Tax=Halyomorpha halys TaxID=286706 RepID=UPI0034D2AE32
MTCLFLLTWGIFLSSATVIKVSGETFSYTAVGQITFYCIVTVYLILFLKLSTEWPDLMEEWLEVEQQMVGMPPVRAVHKIRIVFLSIFIYAIVEHVLCQLYNLERARMCDENNFIERYFLEIYDNVFRHFRFSMWMGIILVMMNFFLTLVWTFTDIFLMSVCIALSVRFEQLQTSLKRIMGQDMSQEFWRESRKRYIKLSFLVKNLDEKFSLLMFFTFFNNVYSICCLLYRALKWRDLTTIHTIYNCAAFILVTVRLYGICLAAGKIHDISKDILPVLFAVPSQSYNVEVHRLFLQIWQDPVSLTGSRFFAITRGLVLKITGTIFTYEIVLAQFNQINPENENTMPQTNCNSNPVKLNET